MIDVKLFVNGKWVSAADGRFFDRVGPLQSHAVSRAVAASALEAKITAESAQAAFAKWARTTPAERRTLLTRAASEINARSGPFEQAMHLELGATAAWAGFNVHLAADMLTEAASLTTAITGEVIPSNLPGSLALAVRAPAGVVLGIAPWNAPVILAVRAVATALACGNTVILKGSERCPATQALVVQAFEAAGFPAGVVNYLTHAPADAVSVVEALVGHAAVRRINFTGSTTVGRSIATLCAKHLKPVVLELGGKAPLLVLDDADLDSAAAAANFGAFANAGQICMSTERIIVDAAVADTFVAKLAARADRLNETSDTSPSPLGPVAETSTVARCNALIQDALQKGARLRSGGAAQSVLMPATLLDFVTPEMDIFHEESFGPVKPIIRVDGVEAAIQVANHSAYGLSAAVFGRDFARAWQVAQRIDSGMCHINGPTVHDEAQMPFGGVKASGYGRFGGRAGIEAFTELRWITVQTEARHYPF